MKNSNCRSDKLAERIYTVSAAREKKSLPENMAFTPEMADNYDYLMGLTKGISHKCKTMTERGVDRFELKEIELKIDSKEKFVTHKKVGKSWLPNYQPRIIYQPFNCFLTYLQHQEQCGWEIRIWRGCEETVSVWLTVLPTRPEITEISYGDKWGEKIGTLRYWFNRGGY